MGGGLAIVQARMTSTRLPGKSAADVGGEALLTLLMRRLKRARRLERIVVATSTDAADDPIAGLAREMNLETHRGSRDDVLGRFVAAAGEWNGALVRVTGDCPLIDPDVVDDVVALFEANPGSVYASNVDPRTYPDGLDVEVVAAATLRALANETGDPLEREHVTIAIRRNACRYARVSLVCDDELGDLRWTVDTAEDLEFVRKVVARLGTRRYMAGMREILAAVRRDPSLAAFCGRRG